MQSILEYLGVYVGGLDLTDERRSSRRWVRRWIIESSAVWGNIQSIVETGCARSHEMERFHQRDWNSEVFPNKNTPPRRHRSGSRTITFKFLIGLPNPLIWTPLNTFGSTSSINFSSMIPHLKEYMSCGTEWWRNGLRYHQRYAKG